MFLREITSRLTKGLAAEIPDLQERVDHILTKQVFGIGITHLTSLLARRSVYCSKHANGQHSIAKGFASDAGNIWFERMEHTWAGWQVQVLRCEPERRLDRGEGLETHAYAFIHTDDIKARIAELFGGDMQFDVIIGNPPYQLDDGAVGTSAAPIYQLFVEQALKLDPRYAVMVTPSRWMAGGEGSTSSASAMLDEQAHASHLVDYPKLYDGFPGVKIRGGICYFLWDQRPPGRLRGAHDLGAEEPSASRCSESRMRTTSSFGRTRLCQFWKRFMAKEPNTQWTRHQRRHAVRLAPRTFDWQAKQPFQEFCRALSH